MREIKILLATILIIIISVVLAVVVNERAITVHGCVRVGRTYSGEGAYRCEGEDNKESFSCKGPKSDEG